MSSGIVIVDTDRAAYAGLVEALERGGRTVRFSELGEDGTAALAIIDFETRVTEPAIPFVAVAANDNAQAIRAAFARGALDVFVKPFSANEVAFKLERLLTSRAALTTSTILQVLPRGETPTNLVVNDVALSIGIGERTPVVLTPREYQILRLLYDAPGYSVTRPSVFVAVWSGVKVCQKVLDVHVSKLRKKLKPLGLTITFVRPNNYVLVLDPAAAVAA